MAPCRLATFGAALIVSIAILQLPPARCDEAAPKEDAADAEREQWSLYYAQQLPRYKFYLDSDKDAPLEVDANAVLKWANPVRVGRTHGDLYVWTYRGRAVLVGTIFSYDTPSDPHPTERVVAHGFHSLSTETIDGTRDGMPLPTINGPGVEFEEIKGAPVPARTRPLRLAQMRQLAKLFTGATREDKIVQPLRPLPQPIYRYAAEEQDSDGAVFAFVSGTDPEIILAIEVRSTPDGPRWHFAAGRYSNVALELKYEDQVVWEFDGRASHKSGYFSQHRIDVQPMSPNVEKTQP
jgi:hypothetical protein